LTARRNGLRLASRGTARFHLSDNEQTRPSEAQGGGAQIEVRMPRLWVKRVAAAAVVFVAAVLLAERAPAAAPAPGGQRSITIAMLAKSEANFIFLVARRGAEAAAKELSQKHGIPVEVKWLTPAREDAAVQAQRIAQAVKDGANAVLIACSDTKRLTPAINAAVDQGVAVATFDSDAPESKRFAFYGADDTELGERLISDLAELLGGKGKVAILAGNREAPNLVRRAEGAKAGAAKHSGLQVVETAYHRETPAEAAAEILRVNAAHPDLAGWAMVGGWALLRSSQTPSLVGDLEKRKLKIVAAGGLPEQLLYVQNGLVPVLWSQPAYLWGKVGVELIVDKLHLNKKVPVRNRMELVRVTKKNLGAWARQLRDWGFTGIPDEYLKLD
jgi:ribose transport system substrate-binding protein